MTIMPIEFYRTAEPFGFLSNYAESPIFVDEVTWLTTEHYYQAQKFADPAQRDAIRAAPTPDAAKRLAWASPAGLRADWDEMRDTVMLAALRAKFAQHADLRAQLLATGDVDLVEHTSTDAYWGDGGDGSGRNRLGELLQQVRTELRQQAGTEANLQSTTPTATMIWLSRAQPLATQMMAARDIPGLIVAQARGGRAPELLVLGAAADGRPLQADTLFPVASITKLATALAVLRLAAQGLSLDEPLTRALPDAAAAGAGITLRTLLSHTAGLPSDVAPAAAPYVPGLDWPTLARACLATPPVEAPHTQVRYSNLGTGLIAILVERLTGQPFGAALTNLVLTPLGIEGYLGDEPPRPPARVSGGLGEHAGTALEPYNSPFWRGLALPWAGLVTTAAGALRLVQAFAGAPPGFLPPGLLADATSDQTGGLRGGFWPPLRWTSCPWGLGPELRGAKTPHWTPAAASPGSFGHLGASGALAWCDPAADVTWVILGTRTFETWWMDWPQIGDAVLAAA